ncbi:MAG: hypothetical protein ACYSYV_07555 [Planctomycetota bacterium]
MIKRIAIIVLGVGALAVGVGLLNCSGSGAGGLEKGEPMSGKTIEQVLKEKTDEWMGIPGVVGTAIGMFEDKPCIKILTSTKEKQLCAKIPSAVEGYPVIIEETGEFRALEKDQAR